MFTKNARKLALVVLLFFPIAVSADNNENKLDFSTYTRYMALGDSLVAGYGAGPVTKGYVYRLYKEGVFDKAENTLFSNAGVPGVTSAQVLAYQVPQATDAFRPDVITITVGGNDLLAILQGADYGMVLSEFQTNLIAILSTLRTELPETHIYISNLYTVPQIPGANEIVPLFNLTVGEAASAFGVPVADVYSAFLGETGLLLIEKEGASPTEVHPTNDGYKVMAKAFEALVKKEEEGDD